VLAIVSICCSAQSIASVRFAVLANTQLFQEFEYDNDAS
jgi:hypothetical protein